ncbi:MAG: RNA polymerase sigma factor [Lewinella sp.]|jgi:RNA polymerase sigma-70 factor (ECF subfamily)|uniref:RNA polymerase sigma factor n=1 Tax=Lewinella sp. TaxID=2004506 RepID=UPI003D6B2AA7
MTTAAMTESELIDACLDNDRLAQKELYDRYSRAMYTAAYRITSDFELANDVLQEAFVKIFRHLAGFRRESTLGAWIKTIVVRTALSRMRREIRMETLEDYHHKDQVVDWGHHLDADYLEKAIQALPAGYRSVFVMIEVEGYAHKEVAEMLGISVGTSKSQLFYAKKKLRKSLEKYR